MILRWIGGTFVAAAFLALVFVGWVYSASEAHLRSFKRPPPFAHIIPQDAPAIARGDHLVRTRGCRGCHGDDLAGDLMWGYAVAPNLPRLARNESAATLEAAIRHGIGRDGTAFYSMPSYNFIRLTDDDMAAIIAYLRSAPVVEKDLPLPSLPWPIRYDIAIGRDDAVAAYVGRVPLLRYATDPDSRIARGEYTAMTTCNECHGLSLRADNPWFDDHPAPDLVIAGSYSEADFRHLMRTGKAMGNRELEMMSPVARGRFAHFTDEEVGDLYAFLQSMSAEVLELPASWIRLASSGSQDKPFPTIWIATSAIEVEGELPARSILKEQEFKTVLTLTRDRCANARGPLTPGEFGVYDVAESISGAQRAVCVFSPVETCDFARQLLSLGQRKEFDSLIDPFNNLILRLGCNRRLN